ncbi:DUF4434 domain-containing protein [Vibrio coralliilyticus]|uniref:DUF4434 domain-containing protein n=1 Tax=Vibrio coralliilyticus TaxID=190893 RepID=UPI0009BEA6D7|nr:DUF4434 domain-containing protein [Vibrio coralliilyticus]AXN29973.1 DUF4434 domain-containing protein [Vibrio coralliilyticus]
MATHYRQHWLSGQRRYAYLAFLFVLLTLFSLSACQHDAPEEKGIFYQPLSRDKPVSPEQWRTLLSEVERVGIRSLVVQWNQYGEEAFGGRQGWLAARLESTIEQGSKIWLGLYADPDYFQSIHGTAQQQNRYLQSYFEELGANYQRWHSWVERHRHGVAGLYIPMELSDYDFDTKEKRKQLEYLLQQHVKQYDIPLMISVYLSGAMSPKKTQYWLQDLTGLGLKVLLQDGRGTQLLDDETWDEYAQQLGCDIGIINEIFVQQEGNGFSARKLNLDQFQAVMKQTPCHASVLFSLRYLPFESNPLKLAD